MHIIKVEDFKGLFIVLYEENQYFFPTFLLKKKELSRVNCPKPKREVLL